MNRLIGILIFIYFASVDTLSAQNTFVGGGMTLSTYFGDLSPYTLKQSWTQIHPGFGFYAARKIIDPIFIQVEFEQSTLTGDDKRQRDESRRLRNLSFRTPITSFSASLGFRTKEVNQNRIGITGSGGIGFFKFDPHAKIDGQWVRLQPLGTEGQGLPGNTSGFYKLIQSAKILQLGAYYRIGHSLFIEVQISQYFTSTDFLDDVSGDYFDPEQLRLSRGDLTWRLADRHTEIALGAPNFPQGTPRGNPTKNDQFAYFKIGIGWALSDIRYNHANATGVKCPSISKYW